METPGTNAGGERIVIPADENLHQSVVRALGDDRHRHAAAPDRGPDGSFEHAGGGTDRMMPVHVPVHLVFGEEEGLERAYAFLLHAYLVVAGRHLDQGERG